MCVAVDQEMPSVLIFHSAATELAKEVENIHRDPSLHTRVFRQLQSRNLEPSFRTNRNCFQGPNR